MEGETAPAPTWGSTINVASGSSTQTTSHASPPPALRVLNMLASPEEAIIQPRENRAMEASSPVEDFSSPTKAPQVSELGESYPSGYAASGGESLPNRIEDEDLGVSESDGTPSVIRVGTWLIPPIREQQASQIDIDPNGDDDQVALQVERVVAQERELKRRRVELDRPPSSIPSQESHIASGLTSSRIPRNSTPPPKRQRRGRNEDEPSESIEKQPSVSVHSVHDRPSDDSMDLSDLADPANLLSDPLGEASIIAITKYVKASPLIPKFLKEEIVRCVAMKGANHSQSQGSKSDSDTQEDGYLKTKPFWVFELLRINKGKITAGNQLTSEVLVNDSTMVLHIFSDVLTYGLQMIGREPLMMSRNEARSNPWFDGHGHPFSVVYQKPVNIHNEGSTSGLTQASAEQLSLLQSEIEQLSEERRIALSAQEQAERKLKEALASSLTTQEDNDFLREQYREASNMATQLARSTTQLEEEIASLKVKLSTGLESVRAFSQTRIQTLQTKLKSTQGQLHLLTRQNQLTDVSIREKAAKWDAYEAKKRAKEEDLERRRSEVDEERAALYRAIEEEDRLRAIEAAKAPHVRFLEIDLADQRETIEGLDEEEDEIALLRAEAGQSASEIDLSAPRSSRRRTVYTPNEQQSIAQAIAQTQDQAQAEMADVLQGELAYHQDAHTHVNGLLDQ
jgi:hypothetical protein